MATTYPLSITWVIPAHNEAASVQRVVRALRTYCTMAPWIRRHEVVVVDDGSTDDTGEQAFTVGARVYRFNTRQGYGSAIKAGVRGAYYQWVGIIDADGTYPPLMALDLTQHLHEADMVIAKRFTWISGDSVLHRVARWSLVRYARWVTGYPIQDLNSGFRVFRKAFFTSVASQLPNGFSLSSSLTVLGYKYKERITYAPILYYRRQGLSKAPRVAGFLGILRQVWRLSHG